MVQKQISIYAELETQSPFSSDQLVIEVSNTHIAVMVKFSGKNHIGSFELFEFDNNQMNWYDIFRQARTESIILDRSYNDTHVFFNLNESVIIPTHAFSTHAADDYLTSIHGDSINHVIKYDNVAVPGGLVNIYRVKKSLNDMINSNLMMVTPRHVYSKLLENILNDSTNLHGKFLKLQFYNQFMLLVVLAEGKLQLIQSYAYTTAEDILYYLLAIAEQFHLSATETRVDISGIIDLQSKHFGYIEKVFKNLNFTTLHTDNIFLNYIDKYPPHYFTPFLNLTV